MGRVFLRSLVMGCTLGGLAGCVPNDSRQESAPAASAESVKAAQKPSTPRPSPPRPAVRSAALASARSLPARPPDPVLTAPYSDSFDRDQLGDDWAVTSSAWRIQDGQLCVQGARNHPAWLKRRLPVNARIEFDATSSSSDGDIKAEFWGDGRSAAKTISYTQATSYLTIFGGWKNQFHVLARIDEHAKDRPEIRLDSTSEDLRAQPVEPNRKYHFKVERADGKTIRWLVDDIEILSFEDRAPLRGPGHEHFGFNDWDVRVCFDNLTVVPLP